MQPIERYGVVALLFLVATFTAVLVMGEGTALGAEAGGPAGDLLAKRDLGSLKPDARRLRMTAGIQAAPLDRENFLVQRAEQEAQEIKAQERLMHERALRVELDRQREEQLQAQSVAALGVSAEQIMRGGFALAGETPILGLPLFSKVQSPVAQAPRGQLRSYKVKPGDTMGEIALAELGTSKVWKMISEVNDGLVPAKLIVNRTIMLPSREAVAAELARRGKGTPAVRKKPAQKSSDSIEQAGTVMYTVAEGESLWRIAQKQLGDGKLFSTIVALNPGINPNNLRVGQKLKLPKGATPSQAAAPQAIAQKKNAKRTGRVR